MLLAFLLLTLLTGRVPAQDNPPPQENPPQGNAPNQENPPARVARISYLKGDVSFQPAGQAQWSQATLNFTVTTGDRLYTNRGARAELEAGSYTVRLSDATDLTVTNLNDQIMQLGLGQGALRVSIYELPSASTVEVDTPNGALTLLEQGTYRVDAEPNGNGTRVSVNSGSLEISGGGVTQTLRAGRGVELTGTDPVQVNSIDMPGLDSFDRWSEERDHRVAESESGRYVSRSIPGYRDLDDYGHWREVPEYGPVWYPERVPEDWVPYRYGHWAWIDPWGWTWVEDEPWGFCPFHYGRWVHAGFGWGWLPGPYVARPVYAPALVVFVGGPHFAIGVGVGVGWFPLGPGEPYYPWYHHREDYLREVNVTNIRNVTNVTNITNVTNVTNVTNINYVNRGVATTAVSTTAFRGGQPVARQAVRVSAQQLSTAHVIPHPEVTPTARATAPGKVVTAPPVRNERLTTARVTTGGKLPPGSTAIGSNRTSGPPTVITRTTPPTTTGNTGRTLPNESAKKIELPPGSTAIGSNRTSGPPTVITRTTPPTTVGNTGRTLPNESAKKIELPPGTPANNPAKTVAPRFITKTPPPPPYVPFETKRQVMAEHPGRPLEPQQIENLRTGKPAGPMLDKEFPPHTEAVHREIKAAAPPPRPPSKPEAPKTGGRPKP
jgi:hypothetical protein